MVVVTMRLAEQAPSVLMRVASLGVAMTMPAKAVRSVWIIGVLTGVAVTRPALRVKFVAMMFAGRVVEAMKPVRMRTSAKMKSVVSAVGKTMPAPIARFALKRVVRLVVEVTKTAV